MAATMPRERSGGQRSGEQFTAQELHHRVSNHLQILASIVGLKARDHPEIQVRDALLEVRRRILAIARLNGQLQRDPERDGVEMAQFFRGLAEDMRLCFSADQEVGASLVFEVEAGEAAMDMAISLALITNELVSNAVKYAVLPSGGDVRIQLRRLDENGWKLVVSDDGPGLPPGALGSAAEHGLSLVRFLVRRHHGQLEVEPSPVGASIAVSLY